MSAKIRVGALFIVLLWLVYGVAEAVPPNGLPPGPPFTPPGPPPWEHGQHRSVPLPATDLLLGIGLLGLPWLRSKMKK